MAKKQEPPFVIVNGEQVPTVNFTMEQFNACEKKLSSLKWLFILPLAISAVSLVISLVTLLKIIC